MIVRVLSGSKVGPIGVISLGYIVPASMSVLLDEEVEPSGGFGCVVSVDWYYPDVSSWSGYLIRD